MYKDYEQEAINEGIAYDAQLNPSITREKLEERYSFLRTIFDDLDAEIDKDVNYYAQQGVVFFSDLEDNMNRFILLNLPKYIDLKEKKLLKYIDSFINKEE